METLSLHLFIVVVLFSVVFAHPHPTASCPNPPSYSSLHHGHIAVQIGGAVSLQNGVDSLFYNYTLPAPFQKRPGVAIAIKSLQAAQSQDLFFSIRSSKTDSLAALTFLVRTQWKYTSWSLISVSFFAEDNQSYEANSFSIDTTALAGCSLNKQVLVMLPYRSTNFTPSSALAFLHGFEMTTNSIGCKQKSQQKPNPYEIQLINVRATNFGVSLKITVTTQTQVFNVFVSIIAWDINAQYTVGSLYQYDTFTAANPLKTKVSNVQANVIDVYGISGFIIGSGQFYINSTFANNQEFTFYTFTNFTYLTYSYFFISTPPCSDCVGNPYAFNGTCYAKCPLSTYQFNGSCLTCPLGQIFNGTACVNSVPQCPIGLAWNGTACINAAIPCPPGLIWNGSACVSSAVQCPTGMVWNGSACMASAQCPVGTYWNGSACVSSSCNQCPLGTYWNGSACVSSSPVQCPAGTYWNGSACVIFSSFQCPTATFWNGTACVASTLCIGGQLWNGSACICPSGQYFSNGNCISCGNGQIWSSLTFTCVCPNGLNWNGYNCISCPSGQFWCSQTNTCSCPLGQNWNGFSCVICDGGRVWNQLINGCQCPSNLNWNGSQCISCPRDQFWNGFCCIACASGQIWNSVSLVCECQLGSQWNGTSCIQPCPSGQISVGGVCQCPLGLYLNNGICQTTPSCPSGTTWNGTACCAISCPAGSYWNGVSCITQVQNCPAGTFWGGFNCITLTTQCPPGTQWNGVLCRTNITTCPLGSYWNGTCCQTISSQCPPGLNWINGVCQIIGNQCPSGTYFNSQICIPLAPCTGGKIWNQTLLQCICPQGALFNGLRCLNCGGNQVYDSVYGCLCSPGLFWDGNSCNPVNSTSCRGMENSQWVNGKCECLRGYFQKGRNCVCNGLASNGMCDPCYQKPYSSWRYSRCQCHSGYYQSKGSCVKIHSTASLGPNKPSCNVATFFDNQQKECLPCSDGCLSCSSCYTCTQCRPEYTFCPASQLCNEICGDGKRFTLQCDDGNNNNGDGCSADCQIEAGHQCTGGSPNSRDACTPFKPNTLVITQTGQSHVQNRIVLNIKLNYLPQELMRSATDCKNSCDSVLQVTITNGDKAYTSIVSRYIATTTYSFSVEINFGREPIGLFTVRICLNSGIALKYFSGINTSNALTFDVNPAFLSLYSGGTNKGDRLG